MIEKIKSLDYNSKQVRTIMRGDELWWVLADVCQVLNLSSPHKVAERVDEDERNQIPVTDAIGRKQETTIINESGLYNVILRSDKPEAKAFKRWVTHEVLPSIRKTGQYFSQSELEWQKRFHVSDVPENQEAQAIIREIRDMSISVGVMLNQYNCYRPEEERKGYANVLQSICGRLYTRSVDLGRIRHKTVYRPY